MATPPHRSFERSARALGAVSQVFWLLVLSVIVLFAFFLALGTFTIGEVGWVAGAVGVLVVLWCVHAALMRRHADERTPDLVRQRERRGF